MTVSLGRPRRHFRASASNGMDSSVSRTLPIRWSLVWILRIQPFEHFAGFGLKRQLYLWKVAIAGATKRHFQADLVLDSLWNLVSHGVPIWYLAAERHSSAGGSEYWKLFDFLSIALWKYLHRLSSHIPGHLQFQVKFWKNHFISRKLKWRRIPIIFTYLF